MQDLFSYVFTTAYWFDPNPGPASSTFQVTTLTLFIEFALLVYASMRINKESYRFSEYSLKLAKRVIGIAGLVISLALALSITRLMQIPVISMRALLAGTFLIGVFFAGYFAFYMRSVYPLRVAAFNELQATKRYMPKPKSSGAKGKRDKKKRRK